MKSPLPKPGRFLVTGAAGFVGSHIVRRLLREGAEVSALVRPETDLFRLADVKGQIRICYADLRDRQAVEKAWGSAAPEVVIHGAIYGVHPGRREEDEMLETNVFGTRQVLRCAQRFGVRRLVVLGGSSEYGKSAKAMAEDDALNPVSLYGTSKAMAGLLCRHAAREHGVPVVILRLFSVYGPWEPAHRLIPTAIDAALSGRPLALTGPGLRRDFVYVDDVCDAVFRSTEVALRSDSQANDPLPDHPLQPGEIINVGSGQQHANEDVAALVDRITGGGLEIQSGTYRAHATDTGHWVADVGKADRLLSWRPSTSLEQGLRNTVEWHRSRAASNSGVKG